MAAVTSSNSRRKFVNEPNSHLFCPICRNVYTDPVINIECGHTFCRQCANRRDEDFSAKCPLDSKTVNPSTLVPNKALEGQIDDLVIYCQNAVIWSEELSTYVVDEESCPATFSLREEENHEAVCEFSLVPCPQNPARCGTIRRHQLNSHVSTCVHLECSNKDHGCDFLGSKQSVERHELLCSYSQSTSLSPQQVRLLLQSHQEMQHQVDTLSSQLAVLSDNYTQLTTQNARLLEMLEKSEEKYKSLEVKVEKLSLNKVSPTRETSRRLSSGNRMARSSSSSLPSPTSRVESWVMPFQFKCIGTLRGHSGTVWCLQRKGSILFSAAGDHSIKLWNLDVLDKGCQKTLTAHTDRIHCMAVGEQYLYSAGADNSICAWSLSDYSLFKTVKEAHDNVIAALVICDKYLFSSSHQVIKVWDTTSVDEVHSMSGLHHWVRSLAVNVTKDKLYSGSHNTIEIWDCCGKFNLTGKITHTYGSAHSLAVTDKFIITGTYNHNTHIFDVEKHQHVIKLTGHVGTINAVLPSLSGRFLFTASSDSSVQLWSLENMLPIQTLSRHEDSVTALAVSGDLLFTGSEDTEIKVFRHFKMDMGFQPK